MEKLPVCFNADAGGGRFVASFAFLNRTDSKVLHEDCETMITKHVVKGKSN